MKDIDAKRTARDDGETRRSFLRKSAAFAALPVMGGLQMAPAMAQERLRALMAGPPTSWKLYGNAIALSDLLNKTSRLDVTVRANGGALDVMQAMIRARADLGYGTSEAGWSMAFLGFGDFEGRAPATNLRAVLNTYFIYESFVTPPSTGITSIADLKGKRIGWVVGSTNTLMPALLQAYGIDPENDIEIVRPGSYGEVLDQMRMGRIDAYCAPLAPSSTSMTYYEAAGALRLLGVDADKWDLAKQQSPNFMAGRLPFTLQTDFSDHLTFDQPALVSASPVGVAAHDQTDPEITYEFVKNVLAHLDDVRELALDFRDMDETILQASSVMPYHEGAKRALEEAGWWTDEMQKAHLEAEAIVAKSS